MKAYLSYSTPGDQIFALRLQTLASVYGVEAYVPGVPSRAMAQISERDLAALQASDVILAIVLQTPSPGALAEISAAQQCGKFLLPIVSPGVYLRLEIQPEAVFVLNPDNPAETEQRIVEYLAQNKQSQEGTKALLALATVALGLFLFTESK